MNLLKPIYAVLLVACCAVVGCAHNQPAEEGDADIHTKTPVTVTSIATGPVSDSIVLNATTSFLRKNSVKSDAVGYVQQVNVKIGDEVSQGQVLFTIETKEAAAIHSKVVDSLLNFTGKFDIKANSNGVITELDKLQGDYVADGDQLCLIAQKSSLVFLLNVPYELNKYVHLNAPCQIELPDGSLLNGVIQSRLSTVDAASQTQNYVVKASTEKSLPENLIAKARIEKSRKSNGITLPKEAVLTDETEDQFWVMKLINDTTAVKVPITKGIVTDNRVEILSPTFTDRDKILLSGNYGLPDTATVQVLKPDVHE